jgi:hypothetical protein
MRWRKSSYTGQGGEDCVEVAPTVWRKSSHSLEAHAECVEIAELPRMIAVRDSKHPDGPVLTFGRPAFTALTNVIRYDHHPR